MLKTKQVSVLVIGSGISGLFTVLKLAQAGISSLLITKSSLAENNSRYAQGGIAAVLPSNGEDSLELHLQDTLQAGAGLCDSVISQSILAEGYPAIEDLLSEGVTFDRTADNQLALTQEAAHSTRRILHAGGDATGHSVEMTLIDKVKANPLTEVMEHCQVIELLSDQRQCYGCRAISTEEQQEYVIFAQNTVLATGGVGKIYSHTTNPAIATGDGIALAYNAGAVLQDMEFIQFHPTAFYAEGQTRFLISEALRGEGGILRNSQGEAFAKQYHPDGELAPRDIVTRAIYSEMKRQNTDHMFLDMTHLPSEFLEKRFPNILNNCERFGINIRTQPIPVAPAAHYIMGGVAVDQTGQTSVQHLFSVGETACTGLHGANRLASNSLLECVVLARRVGHAIANQANRSFEIPASFLNLSPHRYRFDEPADILGLQQSLHQMMWQQVGIVRSQKTLETALSFLDQTTLQLKTAHWEDEIPEGVSLLNQLLVARLITQAALARTESRGAHYREDYPEHQLTVSHSQQSLLMGPQFCLQEKGITSHA